MTTDISNTKLDTLLGIPIGVVSLDSAVAAARAAMDGGRSQIVFACANAHSMNVTRRDPQFRAALLDADQLVADGSGVTLIAGLARKNVGPRIIGQQYFEAIMAGLVKRGRGRVFFFGSTEEVLQRIRSRFAIEYPVLTMCGAISPPFGEWNDAANRAFIDSINDTQPDVLWVGMTAPKQEKWVYDNRKSLVAPVIGSIGAVFDFYAGTVKASPQWLRRLGLESLYRLAKEPRRLWRRVLVSNLDFVRIGIWREVFGVNRDKVG